MGLRSRKLMGTILTVGFLVVYSLVAMVIAAEWTMGWPEPARLAFYLLAGVLWLPPVMAIIRWMARPA